MLWLIFILYQCVCLAILPLFIVIIAYRHYVLKKKTTLKERLGFVPHSDHTKKVIWIHAVSVGEILSIEHVISQIKQEISNVSCYVTTGTASGKKMAHQLNADHVSYLPFDFLPCIILAYQRVQPFAVVLIEAEFWPNLMMYAHLCGIPLYALNARVSKRSLPRYKHFSWLLKPLLRCFSQIYTQTNTDKQLFEQFGVKMHHIVALGNIKACNVLAKKQHHKITNNIQKKHTENFTLLAGSIHPGEAGIYLRLFSRLKQHGLPITMILVPRHFTWMDDLNRLLKQSSCIFQLWTPNDNNSIKNLPSALKQSEIIGIAKLGMLFNTYEYAHLFFLGGTFVPVGGHNLMEPAVWRLPTIVGPYHSNCLKEVIELKKIGGLSTALDEDELYQKTLRYVTDKTYATLSGANALQWITNEGHNIEKQFTHFINRLKN